MLFVMDLIVSILLFVALSCRFGSRKRMCVLVLGRGWSGSSGKGLGAGYICTRGSCGFGSIRHGHNAEQVRPLSARPRRGDSEWIDVNLSVTSLGNLRTCAFHANNVMFV